MATYRDPIIMVYPDRKRILCLFEADGEVGNIESVQRIDIESARKVCRYTKTPAAKTDAVALIGGVVSGINKEKNEDIANLKAYLEDRKTKVKTEPDANGDIWELMDELTVDFDVEDQMYDNNGNKIEDFLIDTDGEGLYWCFFWLKGIHATETTPGKKKGRLVGRAAGERGDDGVDLMVDLMSIYTDETLEEEEQDDSNVAVANNNREVPTLAEVIVPAVANDEEVPMFDNDEKDPKKRGVDMVEKDNDDDDLSL